MPQVETKHTTLRGPTDPQELHRHQSTFTTAMSRDSENNVHSTLDDKPHARCPTCTFTGVDTKCVLSLKCDGWFHSRCQPRSFDVCAICNPVSKGTQLHTIAPLSAHELRILETTVGPIYTSTDGSVKGSQTDNASSTWGICIRVSDTVHITRRGKIFFTKGEESS